MNAHVVYATITGNNEDVADIIVSALKAASVTVKKTEISQTEVDELEQTDIAIVVPYTYDNGSLPDEGLDFFDDLAHADLEGATYGVAGSGDIYYRSDFGLAVPKFEAQFSKTNAKKGAQGIKINLRPNDADALVLNSFVAEIIKNAQH